jgi:hypothetical protein
MFSLQILRKMAPYKYDLVVGVSAGAILGALVVTNRLLTLDDEAVKRYTAQIFGHPSPKGPLLCPKYTGVSKSQALHDLFGCMKFGDVESPLAVLVDRIGNSPTICRSWDPVYRDLPLVTVLDATSAVPVLFPPVTMNNEQYIDGGTVSGSPICIAYLVARVLFPMGNISMLSIGTTRPKIGRETTPLIENSQMGIVQLISLGVPMKVLKQGSLLVNELTEQLMGPTGFLRIEGDIHTQLDDTSVFTTCCKESDAVWATMESSVDAFLNPRE